MKRTAEVIDVRTGAARRTGHGASFEGEGSCLAHFANLEQLDRGKDAPFWVDWHNEQGDLLHTFGIDEAGFRQLLGVEPRSAEDYVKVDESHWLQAQRRHREMKASDLLAWDVRPDMSLPHGKPVWFLRHTTTGRALGAVRRLNEQGTRWRYEILEDRDAGHVVEGALGGFVAAVRVWQSAQAFVAGYLKGQQIVQGGGNDADA